MEYEKQNTQTVPIHQRIYGGIVQWFTIVSAVIALIAPVFILAMPNRNVLAPNRVFSIIFNGQGKDVIWEQAASGFPGGHFYLGNIAAGDGFAQFGVVLGCSVVAWALIPTIVMYFRSKEYFYACVCLFIALLILFAMTGLIAM